MLKVSLHYNWVFGEGQDSRCVQSSKQETCKSVLHIIGSLTHDHPRFDFVHLLHVVSYEVLVEKLNFWI